MKNHLILGNWNALCDVCGRKFKALDMQKRWDGLMVCKEDFEIRHPSDFLRVQREKISVPWVRPYPAEDTFISVNSEGVQQCTFDGLSAQPALTMPGCTIPSRAITYTLDSMPSYCTINSLLGTADYMGANCGILTE